MILWAKSITNQQAQQLLDRMSRAQRDEMAVAILAQKRRAAELICQQLGAPANAYRWFWARRTGPYSDRYSLD